MSPLATLATALSSLGASKLRSSLTLLGIVIGVAAVISLMAIGQGVQRTVTSSIESLGTNLLFVRPSATNQVSIGIFRSQGSASTLTIDDAYALLDPVYVQSVEAVAPELNTTVRLAAGGFDTFTQVIGVTPEYEFVRNVPVASGQFISWGHVTNRSEVAVLGSQLAERLFGFRDPTGQTLRINGRQFTVIGVLESMGSGPQGFFDGQVLVPITTAHYRLAGQRTPQGGVSVWAINVQVQDAEAVDSALQEIATVLRLRHRITGEDDFMIISQQETIEALEETTNTLVVFLGAIAGISLLVGGIGIMNIMLVSVTERTREIGIRKAVGAKRRDILFQFVAEATLLSLGGGGVGVLLGLALARLVDGQSLGDQVLQTAFSVDIAVLALVVSAAIGLFFGTYPAVRAAGLRPIEALRYE